MLIMLDELPSYLQMAEGKAVGDSTLAAPLQPREEAREPILDALERPLAHGDGIGAMAVWIIGADEG